MNTFLPYADYQKSAQCLDMPRLGKQRVECLQLIKAIVGLSDGWNNHPCTNMWRNELEALIQYSLVICNEWIERGYSDSCFDKITEIAKSEGYNLYHDFITDQDVPKPWWFGDERLHAGYRSNLLRKDEKYYRQYGWTEPITLPYWWPNE